MGRDVESVKIMTTDAALGMKVLDLDRPWLETPFLFQGFEVSSDSEIKKLQEYCQYIQVDRNSIPKELLSRIIEDPDYGKAAAKLQGVGGIPEPELIYEDETDVEEELGRASKVASNLVSAAEQLYNDLKLGKGLELKQVQGAVTDMVDSVLRNPDAMIWLMRMKDRDEYTYRHSIASSVWAVTLGRQLGLSKANLEDLAMGTMLCDIGKSRVDSAVLNKAGKLTDDEFELVKQHVQHSLDLLAEANEDNLDIKAIVEHHHERHNGTGYPKGLKGKDIPVFARIAAIADCYDAMISQRVYQEAMSPSCAIKKLYEWRDYGFQSELIEVFIKAVGIYPSGCVVELSDGRVAIVLAEGRKNRLYPTVLVILDSDKNFLEEAVVVNLASINKSENQDEPLVIKESLPNDAYGIDPYAYCL